MRCAVEMGSCGMICIQSSMNIGTGVQAILVFNLRNLNSYSAGITARRDSQCTPLKWAEVA
jgi:hypothetical protein